LRLSGGVSGVDGLMGCWVARKMAAGVEKHLGRFF
jgi:hypothetical protein